MLFTEGTEKVFDDISAVRVTTLKDLVAYTRTTKITLDSLLRRKITIMIKIKKFSKPF